MAALTELEQFDAEVFRIETDTIWKGGEDGNANKQGKALANRTKWLKAQLIAALAVMDAHAIADDPHPQYATDVSVATALSQYLTISDYQKSTQTISIAGGTADAITGSYTPPVTALTDGMDLSIYVGSANATATPTFKADGTPAKTIIKGNDLALVPNDILPGWNKLKYNATLSKWVLQTPSTGIISGRLINVQVFSASGTYTPTAGMKNAVVEVVGSGGGGGGGNSTSGSGGGGGGAGGYTLAMVNAATIGANQTVTIGSAGAAGAVNSNGGSGGTSSFGAIASATGGSFGLAGSSSASQSAQAGLGGNGSGGNLNITGGDGSPGFPAASFVGGQGGASKFGGGGSGASYGVAAQVGRSPGSGGGGGYAGIGAQAGALGKVIVWEYA